MWYNICNIIQQAPHNIQERYINGLTICHGHKHGIPSTTHNVLFNISEQNGAHNTNAFYSDVIKYITFLRPDEAMLKTREILSFRELNSVHQDSLGT